MTDRYDGWDLTNRPAMFPFLAEYTNRQTGEKSGGFAWPSMVTEPLRAANEFLNTPSGTLPNPQNPEQQENALTLLMSLYGGNALGRLASAPRNALADTALARYPAVMEERLFRQQPSLGPDTGKPSIMGSAIAGAEAKPQGFIAYHGSPHDFDKFDMSKIGTGEGAQAYGHGLYFAENEGVAKGYRDALSPDGLGVVARGRLRQHGGDIDKTIEYLRSRDRPGDEPFAINNRQALAELERAKAEGMKQGRMYQVRINANPDDFLDWDKPLSGQSDGVKSRLGVPSPDKIAEADRLANEIDRMNRVIDGHGYGRDPHPDEAMRIKDELVRQYLEIDPTESAWWKFDAKDAVARPEAAAKMREAGIPGIRYLDQGSRAAGEGSRNFVVFDDNIIDILKKYGIAPGMAAGANALSNYDPSITY